jgi:hypothetical protein
MMERKTTPEAHTMGEEEKVARITESRQEYQNREAKKAHKLEVKALRETHLTV